MKKLKYTIITFIAVFICFMGVCAYAAPKETKKAIHIVYDDTTGIYHGEDGEFTDKWSQLKNAVQNFVALSNTGDKIVIYPISMQGEGIEFLNNGNASSLVDKIDSSLNGYSMQRSFSVVTSAWEELKEESNSYEKWLILICDGKFEEYKDENSDTSVQEKLVSYASDGIRVISQATSNDGAIYNLKNAENFYCYNASGAKEILQKTLEISNFIYGRKTLTESYYGYDPNTGILTLKDTGLPVSEMIIMVGGSNASLSGRLGDISASEVISIKNPRGVPSIFSQSEGELKYGLDLERNIYTYEYRSSLQPGEYQVNVTGGNSVTVLYKADVDVELRLYRNGSMIGENESISTGTYEYRVVALNPVTKGELTSPLFDGAVYSIRTENQGKITNLDKKEGEISFFKGNTRVETVIDLGTQKFSTAEGFYVFGDADFTVSNIGKYNVKDLTEGKPFTVTVETESAAENVKLYASGPSNIKFRVEKTDNGKVFLIYPEHINDKSYLFTATGDIDVIYTVVIDENGEVLTYSKAGSIFIEDVSWIRRCADLIWYYKWFVLAGIVLTAAFVIWFNSYMKRKKPAKEDLFEKTPEETFEELIKKDEENETDEE